MKIEVGDTVKLKTGSSKILVVSMSTDGEYLSGIYPKSEYMIYSRKVEDFVLVSKSIDNIQKSLGRDNEFDTEFMNMPTNVNKEWKNLTFEEQLQHYNDCQKEGYTLQYRLNTSRGWTSLSESRKRDFKRCPDRKYRLEKIQTTGGIFSGQNGETHGWLVNIVNGKVDKKSIRVVDPSEITYHNI